MSTRLGTRLGSVLGTRMGSLVAPSPLSMFGTDLDLWLAASEIRPTDLNGADVARWPDSSSYGHHVLQATAADQPAYLANDTDGRSSVSFDTANTEFMTTAAYATSTQAYTWSYWQNFVAGIDNGEVWGQWGNGTDPRYSIGLQNASIICYIKTAAGQPSGAFPTTGLGNIWHNMLWQFDGLATGNARLRFWLDGIERALTYAGTFESALRAPATTLTAIGGNSQTLGFSASRVDQMIGVRRAVTADERTWLAGYGARA